MNAPAARSTDWADAIEGSLGDLLMLHEAMLEITRAQRRAISQADPRSMRPILDRQAALLREIAEAEHRRREAVRLAIESDAELRREDRAGSSPPRIERLLPLIEEGRRERIKELAGRLRETVDLVRREQSSVRTAAESLANHMRGLMQQIGRKLSGVGTYSPRGELASARPMPAGVDVTR